MPDEMRVPRGGIRLVALRKGRREAFSEQQSKLFFCRRKKQHVEKQAVHALPGSLDRSRHPQGCPDGSKVMRKKSARVMSGISLMFLLILALMIALIRFYPYAFPFPGYPTVTLTHAGGEGDPINTLFVGEKDQITHSFQQAGWLIPDPITPQTSAKIAAESLAHRSYPTAPVSNLYVFGRVQDLAFEKPTNDVQNRGHIRIWKTGMLLDGQPVWVGAATYDQGIELSRTTHFPTHHIAPTVDVERNAVGADLETTGLVRAEGYGALTAPLFFAHNGGGDYYESDGEVLVINYTQVSIPLHPSAWGMDGLKTSVFRFYDTLLTTPPLALAVGTMSLILVVVGLWPLLRWLVQSGVPRVARLVGSLLDRRAIDS